MCNIKIDPLKMHKIKSEIVNDKEYEYEYDHRSEEYQDDSRMEDSITTNEQEEHEQYDVIQMTEVEHEEDKEIEEPASDYGCETYEEYHLEEEAPMPLKQPKREIQILSPDTSVIASPLTVASSPMTAIPISTVHQPSASTSLSRPSPSSSSVNLLPSTSSLEDDFFCRSVSCCLANLQRINKIKAKVEIFQILEKYVEIEEASK